MSKAFIAACYAAAKKAGVDTSKMSVDQVIDWYNKNKKDGGSSSPKEKIKSSIEKIKLAGNQQSSNGAAIKKSEVDLTVEKQPKEKEDSEQQGKALTQSKEKGIIQLPKDEYAELCGTVNTKFANKIPKTGSVNLSNHFYVFKYSKTTNKIVCVAKFDIEKERDKISRYEEYENERR